MVKGASPTLTNKAELFTGKEHIASELVAPPRDSIRASQRG